MAIIETYNLTKYYGKIRGIEQLNLTVNEGDFFGFIGPNGAGKSTTIRTLLGLVSPTSGSATIFGKDIKNTTGILTDIGYISSEISFYSGMRAGEIIALSAKLRNKDCSKEAKTLCERLQLDPSRKVEELSLGNRKKVGIVCAMQHRPRLYIFDEPTSGLDPLIQKEFFDLLFERQKEGATIFLSSHVLSEIQRFCNRAAIIRQGRIVACGTVNELSKTHAKRVTLYKATHIPEIDGIFDVQTAHDSVSFLYKGDIKDLIAALQNLTFTDISITEPNLEEIFMHFYTQGGDNQ
ncbi:MAG TPA: ABC transporter ATP-binding protein [Clostridiales bacterium]|nr:ABC transporter ATP-binding protein [Clostridiales bacterium]